MGQRIKTRRDTAANWSSGNPILQDGEQGWDTTNKLMKVGDGITAWNSLTVNAQKGGLVEGNGIINVVYGTNVTYTVAHGLGKAPDIVDLKFIVQAAWNGYAIGDEIHLQSQAGITASTGSAYNISANATNLTLSFNNLAMFIAPKGGGGGVSILPTTNVKLTARCWAIK
jgi:Major tropism determinant N-terminal domain